MCPGGCYVGSNQRASQDLTMDSAIRKCLEIEREIREIRQLLERQNRPANSVSTANYAVGSQSIFIGYCPGNSASTVNYAVGSQSVLVGLETARRG